MPISKELLDALVCPLTKAPLILDGERLVSTDKETRRSYAIKNDIPILLVDQATVLDSTEWESVMAKKS